MPSYGASLEINEALFAQIDRELAAIGVFHRQAALKAGLQKPLDLVADRYRSNLPMPGYPGDKKGKKPLRDTVGTKIKEYSGGTVVGVVGAYYPAGAHAHLIEEGHDIVISRGARKGTPAGRVGGFFDLARAVESTRNQRDALVLQSVREAIEAAKNNPNPGP